MKRTPIFAIAALMSFGLVGCQNSESAESKAKDDIKASLKQYEKRKIKETQEIDGFSIEVSFSDSYDFPEFYLHTDSDFFVHYLKIEKRILNWQQSIDDYPNPLHIFDIYIDFNWGEFGEIVPFVFFRYKNDGETSSRSYITEIKNISFGSCPEIRDFEISYYRDDANTIIGEYSQRPVEGVPEDIDAVYVENEIKEGLDYALAWVNNITTGINSKYTLW